MAMCQGRGRGRDLAFALTDLRSLQTHQTANIGPQCSGTDRDSPVQPDAPGKRRQPCGMGGIPLRFLSIG